MWNPLRILHIDYDRYTDSRPYPTLVKSGISRSGPEHRTIV